MWWVRLVLRPTVKKKALGDRMFQQSMGIVSNVDFLFHPPRACALRHCCHALTMRLKLDHFSRRLPPAKGVLTTYGGCSVRMFAA